jgi:hypothetical protein
MLVGIALTLWWGGTGYETSEPALAVDTERTSRSPADDRGSSVRTSVLRYLRGVAIALVGRFWAGALVTGPFVRLIMRLERPVCSGSPPSTGTWPSPGP